MCADVDHVAIAGDSCGLRGMATVPRRSGYNLTAWEGEKVTIPLTSTDGRNSSIGLRVSKGEQSDPILYSRIVSHMGMIVFNSFVTSTTNLRVYLLPYTGTCVSTSTSPWPFIRGTSDGDVTVCRQII